MRPYEIDMLLHSARDGDLPRLSRLLALDGSEQARERDGWTPLMYASYNGHDDCLRAILDAHGTSLDYLETQNDKRMTALSLACDNGTASCIRILLAAGADHETRDGDGWRPLTYAAWNGSVDSVEALLLAGADPDVQTNQKDSAYDHAIHRGHAQCAQLILAASERKALRASTPDGTPPRSNHSL
jgi:ankyrin repeat protein